MRSLGSLVFPILVAPFLAPTSWAMNDDPSRLPTMKTDGGIEGGWVVSVPSGSSDWFNVRYDLTGPLIVEGLVVSTADIGAISTYPRLGLYPSNTALDPSGNTPDIAAPLSEVLSPPLLGGGGLFDHCQVPASSASASGSTHVAVQFPVGDSGLLGVGADSDSQSLGGDESPSSSNPFDSSFFTTDAYATPGLFFSNGEFGLGATTFPLSPTSTPQLRASVNNQDMTGDYVIITTRSGEDVGISYFAQEHAGAPSYVMLFLNFLGPPIMPFTPLIPLTPTGRGYAFVRLGSTWPLGAGGLTIPLVGVSGAVGVPGSVEVSNEITVHSLPDPNVDWGTWDDGTFESGWTVSIPSMSSDFFNVNFDSCPGIQVNALCLAALDFGTSATGFPRVGIAPENTGIDPSGNTPDVGNPYVDFPCPVPGLTFCSTAAQMIHHSFPTFTPTSQNVHQYVQFPAGSVALAIGGDTNATFISGKSGWSLDGYQTPANLMDNVNWGMRIHGF